MSGEGNIVGRSRRIVEELIEKTKLDLVDLTFSKEGSRRILRIFIDRPEGGVTLDDCQTLSERIDLALEVEDFIPGSYVLEVSSPGLDRPLKKKKDFERFVGRLARVTTNEPLDGRKKFIGRLRKMEGDKVILEGQQNRIWEIPFATIARARLEVEL